MALEKFLKTNGVWTARPTLYPDGSRTSRHLNPLNCSSSYLLRLEESTKCISWIFTRNSKMTPKWQKSLSAMEIDYSDCCEPHSSWGDCGDRCCFSRMKISLMLVNRCWIQKPRSENESNIHQRQRRLRWRCPYRRKWLFLSHKRSFLLAFSSISHLLTLLLITVKDSTSSHHKDMISLDPNWFQSLCCGRAWKSWRMPFSSCETISKKIFRIAKFECGLSAVRNHVCHLDLPAASCKANIATPTAPPQECKFIAMKINVWKKLTAGQIRIKLYT